MRLPREVWVCLLYSTIPRVDVIIYRMRIGVLDSGMVVVEAIVFSGLIDR